MTDDAISESELLSRYQAGQRRFAGLEIERDGLGALEGACLDGIELMDCFVVASFRRASLRNAVVHANVKTCDFSEADLTGADFRTAALDATSFLGAKMDGADFTDAHIQGHDLSPGERPDW